MKLNYGSIQGSVHRKLDYNNQDAVHIYQTNELTIGIVADGCGSGSNSEVGAQLGVKKLTKIIRDKIEQNLDWKKNLKEEMQSYSKKIADLHDISTPGFVQDYLLYTLVGFVLCKDQITLFSYGDGVIVINDDIQIIDQHNKPKYLNNELRNSEGGEFSFQEFECQGQRILIGSDGVEDLIEGINKGEIPEYSTFNEFMNDETNYTNPIKLPKLLQKYSRSGVLRDDCTLILLRE